MKRRVVVMGAEARRSDFQRLLDVLGVHVTAWHPLLGSLQGARYDLAIVCADPQSMGEVTRKAFVTWLDATVKTHCGQVLVLAELRSSLWGSPTWVSTDGFDPTTIAAARAAGAMHVDPDGMGFIDQAWLDAGLPCTWKYR